MKYVPELTIAKYTKTFLEKSGNSQKNQVNNRNYKKLLSLLMKDHLILFFK